MSELQERVSLKDMFVDPSNMPTAQRAIASTNELMMMMEENRRHNLLLMEITNKLANGIFFI